jgi:hypothetical protein
MALTRGGGAGIVPLTALRVMNIMRTVDDAQPARQYLAENAFWGAERGALVAP